MELKDILRLYDKHPQVKALRASLTGSKRRVVRMDGLHGSSAAVVTASLQRTLAETPFLVLLNDEEEAGYFYHDLCALLPRSRVLFFPSAYRRAAKYGQRDAASEVLRAEVITALTSPAGGFIVTYPAALAERVAAPGDMARRSVSLRTGGTYDLPELEHRLLDIGFRRTDYVYEPGEFAVRGSILDVYSYAMDYPVRIDFFGDEVDSIRTFEVQTQLSREKLEDVTVVPEMEQGANDLVPFTDYLPEDTLLVCKDLAFAEEVMTKIYDEGFSRQAASAQAAPEEGEPGNEADDAEKALNKERLLVSGAAVCERLAALRRIELLPVRSEAGAGAGGNYAGLHFSTAPQPLFHKNFDLLRSSFDDLHARGYIIYICADSEKQLERLREITAPSHLPPPGEEL
ncbi:MAG: transcription-repair coupling factor, partial [Alloprevotella sp.]|nr:transcription-repair coupling factor [Alloprevotella sp.]